MTEWEALGDWLEEQGQVEWAAMVRGRGWIGVEDRLPEELAEVLVTTCTDDRNGRVAFTATATHASGWHDWRDRHGNVIRVSHWRPMPEPALTAPIPPARPPDPV